MLLNIKVLVGGAVAGVAAGGCGYYRYVSRGYDFEALKTHLDNGNYRILRDIRKCHPEYFSTYNELAAHAVQEDKVEALRRLSEMGVIDLSYWTLKTAIVKYGSLDCAKLLEGTQVADYWVLSVALGERGDRELIDYFMDRVGDSSKKSSADGLMYGLIKAGNASLVEHYATEYVLWDEPETGLPEVLRTAIDCDQKEIVKLCIQRCQLTRRRKDDALAWACYRFKTDLLEEMLSDPAFNTVNVETLWNQTARDSPCKEVLRKHLMAQAKSRE